MAANIFALKKKYPDLFRFQGHYKSVNEESIVLVGTPLHQNLGDHLIAEAEKLFLRDTFPDAEIYEIPTEVFWRNFLFLKRRTPSETKVFITGGGLMGNLYPKHEMAIHQMMDTFSHCKLTILPQTIYYDNNNKGIFFENSRKLMASCRDFKLCTRERTSFEFAKEFLGVDRLILAPDMGLYFKTNISADVESAAGVCLRSDREQVTSENVNMLKQLLEFVYDLKEVNTKAPQDVGFRERTEKLEEVMWDFSNCPVILTDRLQAMHIAILVGTKCIALKSRTGKIESSYDTWLKWDENIVMEDSNLDHTDMMEFINTPYKPVNHEEVLKPAFDRLKEFVK